MDVERRHEGRRTSPFIYFSRMPALIDRDLDLRLREESIKLVDAEVFERRTIDIDGDEADCIASNLLVSQLPVPSDSLITITCQSRRDLHIMSNGNKENIDTFFSIVSQMRKHRD